MENYSLNYDYYQISKFFLTNKISLEDVLCWCINISKVHFVLIKNSLKFIILISQEGIQIFRLEHISSMLAGIYMGLFSYTSPQNITIFLKTQDLIFETEETNVSRI